MIDHTGIGCKDMEISARFYDAALGALGYKRCMEMKEGGDGDRFSGIGYGYEFPLFWIDIFHPHSVKQHTAFRARSKLEVEAFFREGLKAGGHDNGKPGFRSAETGYPKGYYAAFLLDPDGNNMEAVFREA